MKWAAAGLAALTLIRLCVAAAAPLAPDEAYYWVWSRALAPGYLDHPPMVALWIRAGTALAGADAIGVRLLGPLSAALGSWLLYDAAERLFPGRGAGLTAAALLNATLVLGVGAVIMTPDTPLLLFWTATLWAAARLARGGAPAWWLAAGVFTGLALASKYTAAFLPIGLGLFAVAAAPRSLRRPEPWLGGLLAALLFLPVVLWNSQHGWAGFLRQGGRVADWRPERAVGFLVELVGGQIGLATPGVCILLTAGIVMAIRVTGRSRDPAWSLLASLSVPPILVFLQHAAGDRVQGNWPAIFYPAASVAAAGLAAPGWRRWIWPSCGLGFAVAAVLYAHVLSGWPPVAGGRDPAARQLFGWDDLAARVEAARRAAGAEFIAAEPYGVAAELAWALPPGVDVVGVDPHWVPTTLPRAETGARQGILIRPERYGDAPSPGEWRDVTRLPDVVRTAGNGELERYAVFLVRVVDARSAGALLPHR
jgi:4-amino-4-deoxy-L-arabinose transferase-like glycosyltransferase